MLESGLCHFGTCMKLAFVLGKNPQISLAELGAVLGSGITPAKFDNHLAFFDGELPAKKIGLQKFLDRLGGSTEIIEIFKSDVPAANIQNEIENYLIGQHKKIVGEKSADDKSTKKFSFAINTLPESKKSNLLRMLLPRVKKSLREKGIHANFMNNEMQNVNSVFAFKQGLASRGTNIYVIDIGENKVAIGASQAMQDFEKYSKRDYSKPFRDARVGMLPPKLSQILINLAVGQKSEKTFLYDPFCGTGTTPMEALLMGLNAIGSDKNESLVKGANENLEWLKKNFAIDEKLEFKVFEKDATQISRSDIDSEKIAIASEPNLGPPLSIFPEQKNLDKIIADLSDLYLRFFENLARVVPSGTPIVFIFPFWRKTGMQIKICDMIIDKIESFGYSRTTFVPLQKTSLYYDRPDQVVGREIVRFVKK